MNNNISSKQVALFICRLLNQFRLALGIMCLVAIVWAIDISLRPYLLKIIVDRVADPSNKNIFENIGLPVLLYFLMTLIYPTVFRFYAYFVEIKMIPALRLSIAQESFSSLLKQSYSYYQNNFAGGLSNKINDLTSNIPDIVQIILDRFFSHSLALIIAIFTLWRVNALFACGMLAWSIAFIIVSLCLANRISGLADRWSECSSIITGTMVDSLSNILSVQLFARSKKEYAILSDACNDAVKAERKLEWTYFWLWFYYGYSFVAVQGVSLYYLLKGRQEGWITAGDFVVVLSINFGIVGFLGDLGKDFSQFSKRWGRVVQALRSTQVTPEIQDTLDAKSLEITQGEITFDQVSFCYTGVETLFENKSITIEHGQKVGLVGYSGGGKSTFVNLILRLYDITDGSILIDGQDIRNVTQDSLRSSIAMIQQEPLLFHRTIIENIRYGDIQATDEEVIEAAKKAYAHDFIMQLSQGYKSLVGERGVKLSGGQRQRIAIARAILKNAPILILDEATSQLDSVTEQVIQKSLWETMQGKTTIVIAHRLSTLLQMDRILVFDQGEIIQDGTHQGLIEQEGLYKILWETQVGGFLLDKNFEI